jgi:hypothetical protein
MPFLAWLTGAKEGPQATDVPVVCPDCHGDRPKLSVILLRSYVRRGLNVVGFVDGERVQCQECGAEFSVDYRRGTFRHVGRSPNFRGHAEPAAAVEAEPPRPLPPLPLLRPRV